jgi:hypothetical protein
MAFEQLRRVFAQAGASVATARPPGSQGRAEEAAIRPARLVEHDLVRSRPVGPAEPCPHPLAFLDGVQRHQVIGYVGTAPVVAAVVAAAVRRRGPDRELHTVTSATDRLVVGRATALATAHRLPDGHRPVAIPEDVPSHPIREHEAAVAAIDQARRRLEMTVGRTFRHQAEDWLVVDGSLADCADWASDPRMLGISKSHATLPFDGGNLETYLRLEAGCRSSVFQPASHRDAPVYAWGLRLWPWEGRDLLFGLVRLEAAPTEATLAAADRFSRWVLAERVPVSSPDARWDRLLYGIHNVEAYLGALVYEP